MRAIQNFLRAGLIGALLWFAPTPVCAQALDFPQLTGRVVDEANILDAATKIDLETKLENLEKQTSTQFVVVTLKSLRGQTIEDYGYQLGRNWGIGQKGTNNGVLLIVAPNERKVRLEVGYGLEGTLTDAITSVVIQNIILPRFRANDYQGGIQKGADGVLQVLSGNADEFKKQTSSGTRDSWAAMFSVLFTFIFSFPGFILLLIFLHFIFVLFVQIGVWLGLIPPKAKRKHSNWSWVDSSGGGSYSSGGSSWSSGDSGGGFSGGGGSFGGGGSSGSW